MLSKMTMLGMMSLLLCLLIVLCGARYPPDHTLVKYPGPSQECVAKQVVAELRSDMQELVVEQHNDMREQYEASNSLFFHGGMTKLKWNEELANIAQRWADQCVFGHDGNRATTDAATVGQYVYLGYSPVLALEDVADENSRRNDVEIKIGTPTGGNDVVINLGDVHRKITGAEKINDVTLDEILSGLGYGTELTLGSALKNALGDPSVEVRKDDLVVEFIPVKHVPCALEGRTGRNLVVEVGVSGNCHDVVVDWGKVDLDIAVHERDAEWINDIFVDAESFFDGTSVETKLGEHLRNMMGNPDVETNIIIDEVTVSGREFGDNANVGEGEVHVDIGRKGEDVDIQIEMGDVHVKLTVDDLFDRLMEQNGILNKNNSDLQRIKELLSASVHEVSLGPKLADALKNPNIEVNRGGDLVVELMPRNDVTHVPCVVGRERRDLVVEVGVSGDCHDVVVDWGEVDVDIAVLDEFDVDDFLVDSGMDVNDMFSVETQLGEQLRNMMGNPSVETKMIIDEVTVSGREFGDNTEVGEGKVHVDVGRSGEDVDIQIEMGNVHVKAKVDDSFDRLMERNDMFKAGTVGILNENNSDLQRIEELLSATKHKINLDPQLDDALENPNIEVNRGGDLVVEMMSRNDVSHVNCVVARDGRDVVVDVGVVGDCSDIEIALDLGEVDFNLVLEEHVKDLFIDLGAIKKGTKGVLDHENSDLDWIEDAIEGSGKDMVINNHRVDTSFSVGQITLRADEELDLPSILSTAITSWFTESVPAGGIDHILVSSYKLTLADGSEVPQLLFADTSDIGCGLSVYLEPAYPDWYQVLFVCNYA